MATKNTHAAAVKKIQGRIIGAMNELSALLPRVGPTAAPMDPLWDRRPESPARSIIDAMNACERAVERLNSLAA